MKPTICFENDAMEVLNIETETAAAVVEEIKVVTKLTIQ
jgi:hypothetical protein